MIYLPATPSIIRLKSFWLVLSICFSVIISYPLSMLFSLHWMLLALLAVFVIAAPGIRKSSIALLPYRIHNKVCRIFSLYAKEWILLICFCIISVAVGKKGSPLSKRDIPDKKSLWISRENINGNLYDVEENRNIVLEMKCRGFSANFVSWVTESGNWWMILLLPFLSLISVFEQEQPSHHIPDNVYTLY